MKTIAVYRELHPKRILTSLGSHIQSISLYLYPVWAGSNNQFVYFLNSDNLLCFFYEQFFSSRAKPVFNLIAPLSFDSSPNRN